MENITSVKSPSYDSALAALFSSTHQSSTKEAIKAAAARRTRTIHDMHTYMRRIGGRLAGALLHDDNDAACNDTIKIPLPLRIVHVTGTKGKGSVAAMAETILRVAHGETTGLFTSPHLVDIRERIRINGLPVSKEIFAQAYWTVRQRLEEAGAALMSNDDDDDMPPVLPGYFRMLTLLALHIFTHYQSNEDQRITCIVLEVGMGGRYDATNCCRGCVNQGRKREDGAGILPVSAPASIKPRSVCGVTIIDYDHVRILGDTLEQIAWEKGGIYQMRKGATNPMTPHPRDDSEAYQEARKMLLHHPGASPVDSHSSAESPRCFALDTNPESVLDVFRLCAKLEGQGACLHTVGQKNPMVPLHCTIGLPGAHQRLNAELAVALCQAIAVSPVTNAQIIQDALAKVSWPARCQTVELQEASIPTTVRLDGAHTKQSIQAGLEWYRSVVSDNACRVLIFNCSHERSPVELLELLVAMKFDAAYFCKADSERPSAIAKPHANDLLKAANITVDDKLLSQLEEPTWQETLLGIWKHLDKSLDVDTASNLNVTQALDRGSKLVMKRNKLKLEVFVTGSLYLVGSMLTSIGWEESHTEGTLMSTR